MAQSFNTPYFSAVFSDPAGPITAKTSPKIAISPSNGGQGEDFSRVLDVQKHRDRDTQNRTDSGAGSHEARGKALPSEGKGPADKAGNDESVTSEAPRETSASGKGEALAQADGTPVNGDEASADAGAQRADLEESDESARALELSLQNAAAVDSAAAIDGAVASDDSAALAAESDLVNATPHGTAFEAQSGLSMAKGNPLQGDMDAGVRRAAVASSTSPINGALGDSIDASLTEGGVQGVESVPRQSLGASSHRLEGASPIDTAALKQTTADWLRANMGVEGSAQRGGDFQVDGASELLRGASAMSRGDSAANPVLGNAPVAGPAPAATPHSVASTSPSATALPEYALARAPDDAEFPGELTARMKTLARDGVREARLQLHPAELGRLQVTVITEGDQTKVAFTAETAAARDAIEQSLPRLREMLEQSGLQLAQSDVSDQGLQDGRQQRDDGQQSLAESEQGETGATVLLSSDSASSRIDTYI